MVLGLEPPTFRCQVWYYFVIYFTAYTSGAQWTLHSHTTRTTLLRALLQHSTVWYHSVFCCVLAVHCIRQSTEYPEQTKGVWKWLVLLDDIEIEVRTASRLDSCARLHFPDHLYYDSSSSSIVVRTAWKHLVWWKTDERRQGWTQRAIKIPQGAYVPD